MKAVILYCIFMGLISLTSCTEKRELNSKTTKKILEQVQSSLHLELESLKGSTWYAGRLAEKFGFERTRPAKIKKIIIKKFKCSQKRAGAWYSLKKTSSCLGHLNFVFETKGKERVFKAALRLENIGDKLRLKKNILKSRLTYGFVKKNPFSKRSFSRYWRVLKKGKLAIGMPVDYLKICWGKPLRIFDKSIDSAGSRETFVYQKYFVLLENGIVRSIHKFDS